jgi:hypothetical protein
VTQGTSAFEPDLPGPGPEPGTGETVTQPDIKKLGEALRDRIEIRVNLGLGLAVAGVMFLLDMPNPLLWGALAALAEFIRTWEPRP